MEKRLDYSRDTNEGASIQRIFTGGVGMGKKSPLSEPASELRLGRQNDVENGRRQINGMDFFFFFLVHPPADKKK